MLSNKENTHFYGRRKHRAMNGGRIDIGHEFVLPDNILEQTIVDPQMICPDKEIWLEVGFGSGEHLVGQAIANPDIGLIGCEAFINGVSAAAKNIVANDLRNIRLWADDAVPLMAKLPDASIDRFFLLFNDPWPKTKHYKRRFIQPHIVELLARILKPGAQLRLTTDDKSLAEWMLLHTVQNPNFSWDNWQNGDWSTQPVDWIETRYQQKAAQQGRLARYLDFTRI
jgi:tRNA (guanine-N7-)-methyltransferase